jgi:recombination protein RecA
MLISKENPTAMDKKDKAESILPLATMSKADKLKAALSVEKSLNTEYKTILLQKMGKRVGTRLPCYPTNLLSVDEELIGCGGVPKGRIVEIFGSEGSGKTSFALHIVAEVQKAGGVAAYIDAEHSLDPNYASRIGVNVDELLISQPDYGEQALEVAESLVKSRAVDVIIIDSVSALVPRSELDGDMGDASMGTQARLMSQAMRKLTGICNKNGVTVAFINQVREKIGVMFGNPETTSGGRALKFYASLRIKIRQLSKSDGGIVEADGVRVGQRCHLEAVKNKCGGAPYASTDISLMYATGWDKSLDVVDYAADMGVVESGTWYVFKGEKWRKNLLLTRPDMLDTIRVEVLKTIESRRKDVERAAEQGTEKES